MKRNNYLAAYAILGITIGVGLLLLGIQIKRGINNVSDNRRVVSVRGLAEEEVAANKVT